MDSLLIQCVATSDTTSFPYLNFLFEQQIKLVLIFSNTSAERNIKSANSNLRLVTSLPSSGHRKLKICDMRRPDFLKNPSIYYTDIVLAKFTVLQKYLKDLMTHDWFT